MSKKLTVAVTAVSGIVGFLAGLYFAPDIYMLNADHFFDDDKPECPETPQPDHMDGQDDDETPEVWDVFTLNKPDPDENVNIATDSDTL